jgi:glycerophosphoryl diester phosphodiesterase
MRTSSKIAIVCVCLLASIALFGESNGHVWISAHRGAKNVAPENTIAAYDAAAKIGADYVELDVRQTSDGALIIMHDSKVDRTTNGHGAVADLTLEALRKLDAGGGQQIPTFREALLWGKSKGVRIDVDHKTGSVDDIAREIREAGMTSRVVIEGPREKLARFVALLPGVDTMPKVASADEIHDVCASLHSTVIRLSLAQLADPNAVKAVRDCGARVSVTMLGKTDVEPEIRRAIELGAQIIETDHGDIVARMRP